MILLAYFISTLAQPSLNPQSQITPSYQRFPAALNLAANAFLHLKHGPKTNIKLTGLKGFPMKGTPVVLDFASLLGPVFFMCVYSTFRFYIVCMITSWHSCLTSNDITQCLS